MRLIIDADAGVDWSPGIKQQHVRLTARDAVDFLNPQAHVLHTHDGHASQNNSQPAVSLPSYRSTCASRHLQLRTGGFCWHKFYCLHAFADGNQCIQISEKTLEFSSTVLSTVSPYCSKNLRNAVTFVPIPEYQCECVDSPLHRRTNF